MNEPKPGIYFDVPFADYLRWPAVNNSSLGPARKSMAHYHYSLTHPRPSSNAQRLGSLCHCGLLEPLKLLERYCVLPDLAAGLCRDDGTPYASPRATKEYKVRLAKWHEQRGDTEAVTLAEYQQLEGVCRSLAKSEKWGTIVSGAKAEVSICWIDEETGLLCKARLDIWNEVANIIADFKTGADASNPPKLLEKWHYHRQGAFYRDGIATLTGRQHRFFMAVTETEGPYCTVAFPLGAATLLTGRKQYRRYLAQIKQCRESGVWPGYENPEVVEIPSYALEV